MCGYCTEHSAFAAHLVALEARVPLVPDPLLLPVHLQEATDWQQTWLRAAAPDDPVAAIVMLCRAWTDRLDGKTGTPLRDVLGPALHERLQQWLAACDLPDAWAWLRHTEGEPPHPLPLDDARDALDAYLAGWLLAQEGTSPAWDEALLHERLPQLSVALDILRRDAPDDDRIHRLAFSSPSTGSPFSAIDLWLQRRAVRALVARRGMASIATLVNRLRSPTLLATVLHGEMDHHDLLHLQAALQGHPDAGSEGAHNLHAAVALLLESGMAVQ